MAHDLTGPDPLDVSVEVLAEFGLPVEVQQRIHDRTEEHFSLAWSMLRTEVAASVVALLGLGIMLWDTSGTLQSFNGAVQASDFDVRETRVRIRQWDERHPGSLVGFNASQTDNEHVHRVRGTTGAEFIVWWLPAMNGRRYSIAVIIPSEAARCLLPSRLRDRL